jgi:hypothetical protein
MIEFRKVNNPKDDRDYQLMIDGIPLEKAKVYVRGRPDEHGKTYYDISTKDLETSRQIAAHSLENILPI